MIKLFGKDFSEETLKVLCFAMAVLFGIVMFYNLYVFSFSLPRQFVKATNEAVIRYVKPECLK